MKEIKFSERQTPESVSKGDVVYHIPIYQRLFEWEEPQITQLLEDLYQSFSKDVQAPYYIGMLTSNRGNDLIDGQQRFTVMMLLGMKLSEYTTDSGHWNKFLYVKDGDLRLDFKARPEDYKYLHNKCEPAAEGGYENPYMKRGKMCIAKYIEDKFPNDEGRKSFAEYVFNNMSFFISYLPNDYTPKALNKYFETMNSTGKNLENHEILKVRMLHKVSRLDKVQMTQIWNAVSDMDRKLIRRKDKEEDKQLSVRFDSAYAFIKDGNLKDGNLNNLFNGRYINDLSTESDGKTGRETETIGNILADPQKPQQQRLARNTGFRSILSFSEFLLHVLWLCLDNSKHNEVSKDYGFVRFFDVNKLQETFERFHVDADAFIIALLKYRLLYDKYVISISNEDNAYELDAIKDAEEKDELNNSYHDLLLMYESMLYANSSAMTYYLWLPDLLRYVDGHDYSCKEIYRHIKKKDEERHPKSDITGEKLSYGNVDRYWFWKLDFHIWKCRKVLFKDKNELSAADKYVFRRNRSIEHIAPQTPQEDSTLSLDKDTENCFGNLVMISPSQNTSLLNSTFEIKRAKVLSLLKGELSGTIESLKMMMIYQYKEWNEDKISGHERKCLEMLKKEYGDEENTIEGN